MPKIIIDEALLEHLAREKAVFSRTEFTVLPCNTKEQALTIHTKVIADLILIDFEMPEMNIENFCAHVRTNNSLKNAFIVVSVPNKRKDLDRCLMCGVDDLITKPVQHQELIATLTKLLQIKKRDHVRVLMKLAVVGKSTDTFYAMSKNISVSGISIETDRSMVVGDRVSVTFYLRLHKITITGELVRKNEITKKFFQYGIRFLTIDDRFRSLIEDFVKISRAI